MGFFFVLNIPKILEQNFGFNFNNAFVFSHLTKCANLPFLSSEITDFVKVWGCVLAE